MTRLTLLFIITTLIGAVTSILLGCAVIQEGRDRSAAVEAVYKIGLEDGEAFVRGQIVKAKAEAELIEESKANIAEERL